MTAATGGVAAPSTATAQSILSDLRSFLSGVTGFSKAPSGRNQPDADQTVKTATNLLRHLPAAREAVLYFFCQVQLKDFLISLLVTFQ